MFMKRSLISSLVFIGLTLSASAMPGEKSAGNLTGAPAGWETQSPRDEIRPDFVYKADGGMQGNECFIIRTDAREGLDGCWRKSFPVTGGKAYRFSVFYQAKSVALPRRSVLAKLDW